MYLYYSWYSFWFIIFVCVCMTFDLRYKYVVSLQKIRCDIFCKLRAGNYSWCPSHWMVCTFSRYQTRLLCRVRLLNLEPFFKQFLSTEKVLPPAAFCLRSIHAAQVIPFWHGTDPCPNLLCDGQKRCRKPWSDEGPIAFGHYSAAFSTELWRGKYLPDFGLCEGEFRCRCRTFGVPFQGQGLLDFGGSPSGCFINSSGWFL